MLLCFLFDLLVAVVCVVVVAATVVVVCLLSATVAAIVVCGGRELFVEACVGSAGPSSSETYTSFNAGFSETVQQPTPPFKRPSAR